MRRKGTSNIVVGRQGGGQKKRKPIGTVGPIIRILKSHATVRRHVGNLSLLSNTSIRTLSPAQFKRRRLGEHVYKVYNKSDRLSLHMQGETTGPLKWLYSQSWGAWQAKKNTAQRPQKQNHPVSLNTRLGNLLCTKGHRRGSHYSATNMKKCVLE